MPATCLQGVEMAWGHNPPMTSLGLHSCPHHTYRKATARMPIEEDTGGPQKAEVYFTIESKQYLFYASRSASIFEILHIFNVSNPTIYLLFS